MIEQTRESLSQMKLYGMLATLDLRVEEAIKNEWGHIELLSALAQDERLYRDNKRTERLTRAARFRTQASMEHVDTTAKRNLTRTIVKDLSSLHFLKTHRSILLLGPTGVGKTYLASALGNQACREGYSCRFLGMSTLIEHLNVSRIEGSYLRYRDRLAKVNLLIIDDLGIKPLSPETIQDLYDLLEERYQKGATVITSQLPLENWKEVIQDEVAYEAIMDRLIHRAIKIELKGESYRKTQARLDKNNG